MLFNVFLLEAAGCLCTMRGVCEEVQVLISSVFHYVFIDPSNSNSQKVDLMGGRLPYIYIYIYTEHSVLIPLISNSAHF